MHTFERLLSFCLPLVILSFLQPGIVSAMVSESGPSCTQQQTPNYFSPDVKVQIFSQPTGGPTEDQINATSLQESLTVARDQLTVATNHLATAREELQLTRQLVQLLNRSTETNELLEETVSDTRTQEVDDHRPRDCAEIKREGFHTSGKYVVYPEGGDGFNVYCDMATTGGGWTVFQRREDGSTDFFRNWTEYRNGFGNVLWEHWLGNDRIHRLSRQKRYKVRIDLEAWDGETRFAEYTVFRVGGEGHNYTMTLGEYSGTAGDSLSALHNGSGFSTYDVDHDGNEGGECAGFYHGGWWYGRCHYANLNGIYYQGGDYTGASNRVDGVEWYHWKRRYYSMKMVEMKIRPSSDTYLD